MTIFEQKVIELLEDIKREVSKNQTQQRPTWSPQPVPMPMPMNPQPWPMPYQQPWCGGYTGTLHCVASNGTDNNYFTHKNV